MDSDHPLSTVHQGSALFFDQQRSVGPQFHGVGARPQHLGNVSGTIGTSYAKELRFAERKAAATALFLRGYGRSRASGSPAHAAEPSSFGRPSAAKAASAAPLLPAAGKIRPIPLK